MRHLTNILLNKYVIATGFFVALLLFFDRNDVFTQLQKTRQLKQLKQSKAYYQQQIAATQKEKNDLQQNDAALEKIAREKFKMKKAGEDLFLIDQVQNPKKKMAIQ